MLFNKNMILVIDFQVETGIDRIDNDVS